MPTPCPGCNKFPSLEPGDPEVTNLEIDDDGQIAATVRIVLQSSCCNEEMKEYTFEVEHDASCELEGKRKEPDAAEAERNDQTWPSVECEEGCHDKCRSLATDDNGNLAPCSCPCHRTDDSLEVDESTEVDEVKIKGKKGWEMTLTATIKGDRLTEPVEVVIKDQVLQTDMDDMV